MLLFFYNGGHLNSKVAKKKASKAIEKAANTKKKTIVAIVRLMIVV